MEARPGHFMKASMLDSQLAVLEDPTMTGEEGVIQVSIEDATGVQVEQVREGVRGSGVEV
jgi:gluconokinase